MIDMLRAKQWLEKNGPLVLAVAAAVTATVSLWQTVIQREQLSLLKDETRHSRRPLLFPVQDSYSVSTFPPDILSLSFYIENWGQIPGTCTTIMTLPVCTADGRIGVIPTEHFGPETAIIAPRQRVQFGLRIRVDSLSPEMKCALFSKGQYLSGTNLEKFTYVRFIPKLVIFYGDMFSGFLREDPSHFGNFENLERLATYYTSAQLCCDSRPTTQRVIHMPNTPSTQHIIRLLGESCTISFSKVDGN